MSFAENLRALRKERGLTQERIAAASGVTKVTVQNWEAGRRAPSLADAARVADVLGVSLDLLAGRAGYITGSPEGARDAARLGVLRDPAVPADPIAAAEALAAMEAPPRRPHTDEPGTHTGGPRRGRTGE